jgi:hypothetical protein
LSHCIDLRAVNRSLEAWWVAGGYGVLIVIALVPVWMVSLPPLDDYPNHLARMHILINASSSGYLGTFYEIHWTLIPNLAMDLIVPSLALAMPLEAAGKVYVTVTLALLSTGTLALHHAIHRRMSAWPVLAFLFLYNGIFLFGIVNFLFGLGGALWGFAGWIRMGNAAWWRRALFFYAMCGLLFIAHLSALGVFVICVMAYEMDKARSTGAWRIRWVSLLMAAPAGLLAALLWSPSPPGGEPTIAFQYGPPLFAATQKLGAAVLLFRNYSWLLDVITLGLVVWLVLFLMLSRKVRVNANARWCAVALGLAFLVMPYQVMGSNFADARILVAAAFILVAVTDLRGSPAFNRSVCIALAALFGVRMVVLSDRWLHAEKIFNEVAQALETVPAGSRLFAAWVPDPEHQFQSPGPHVAAIAVMKKDVFLPTMYAMPRGQPITFAERYLKLAREAPKPNEWMGDARTWQRILHDYDFVFIAGPERFKAGPPTASLETHSGEGFILLRTRRLPAVSLSP